MKAANRAVIGLKFSSISIGTAYAVWTGIGTVGSTLLGMYVYGESKSVKRIFFITCVVVAVIGLKLIS